MNVEHEREKMCNNGGHAETNAGAGGAGEEGFKAMEMVKDDMTKAGRKFGSLAIDIVEYFVATKLGDKFIKDLRAPTDKEMAVTGAMQATADRLWEQWGDEHLWNAVFNDLPKNNELLPALKQAIKTFYGDPTNTHFAGVITTILEEHQEFSPEYIQKAVEEYVTTLTEQLLLADKDFRENERGLSDLKVAASLGRVEKWLESQKSATNQKAVEVDLQSALARLKKLPTTRIPAPAALPEGSRKPKFPPNPLFVGREEDLKRLAKLLKGGGAVAINPVAAATGMGGVGKTQLASEFAHRYGQYFAGGVFWLSFADPELIPSEVADCGKAEADTPLETRVKQVLSDWQSSLPRLLVFDNCDDAQLLVKWRPVTGASRVLVTSRNSTWDPGLGVQALALGELARAESMALLRGFREDLGADDPDLEAIAAALGDLPLALHMAGSYLRSYRFEISPAQYLAALRRPGRLKHRSLKAGTFSPTGHDLDVERTFTLSVERLNMEDERDCLALELLQRIACFAPGELIPRRLIKDSIEKAGDGTGFADALNRLLGTGLVEQDPSGDVHMHRLVAGFVREAFPEAAGLAEVEKAVDYAARNANHSGYPARMQPLLAHLKFLTDQALARGDEQAAGLANSLGFYAVGIGDYTGARPYFEQALEIRRKALGEQHPDTASSLNNLGFLLKTIGDYTGARPYYEQALEIQRKALGEQHPDTARSLNNLGALLDAMGDYTGARPYYEQALGIRRKALGEQHPDTASSLNNLGFLLKTIGDYTGARPYYEQALEINRKALGEQHPDTARSLNNLGFLLYAMGDYTGTRPYYEQALEIRRKALGEQHPDTARSLNNLGALLDAMGDYTGAKPYYEQALEINRKALGEQHPDTARSLNNLGALLDAMGDYTGARPYYEQALEINRKALGEQHPGTARSLNNLGALLYAMGDYTGAKPYYEQALEINRKALGEQHPDTARSLNNLGALLDAMGDYTGARPYYEQALEVMEKTLGVDRSNYQGGTR